MGVSKLIKTRILNYCRSVDYEHGLKLLYYNSIFFGFIIRLITSLNAWGMKHPDEIYQSLEMAHYLVYGTGFIPPEFQNFNTHIPSYAAARSWLFPLFFSIFMRLGEFLGLDYFSQTLPLIKFYMAIHATLLIPAIYKLTYQISKDQLTATISAFLVAFWFRIVEYSVRTFTNTFFLPMIFFGVYKTLLYLEEDSLNISKYLELGFLLGLSTYIRIDLGIIIFGFFIIYFELKKLGQYLYIGVSGLLFWIWGAWVDYNIYDGPQFFSVIINWFTFNILKGYSENFGVSGPWDYIVAVIYMDLLYPWLLIMILWSVKNYFFKPRYSIFKSEIGSTFKKLVKINLIVWFIFSYPIDIFGDFSINYSHKEIRFIIGGIVLYLMLVAVFMRMLISELSRIFVGVGKKEHDSLKMEFIDIKQVRRYFIVLFLIIFLISSFSANSFRNDGDSFEGFNRSFAHIGQHHEVVEIITLEVWYVTGYYTYSHVSENTEFTFIELRDPISISTIFDVFEEIIDSTPNRFFVIPWYAYIIYDDNSGDSLEKLLLDNNWVMEYEYGGVHTWQRIN